MSPIQPQGLRHARSPATVLSQMCSLCSSHRLNGGLLLFHPGTDTGMVWVCDDCQHKLARRVDDEGALGG